MLMLFQLPFGSLPHLSKQLSDAIQREAKQVDGIDVPHFRWRATNIDGPQENFQQISSMQMGILCLSEFPVIPVDLFFCTQKKKHCGFDQYAHPCWTGRWEAALG